MRTSSTLERCAFFVGIILGALLTGTCVSRAVPVSRPEWSIAADRFAEEENKRFKEKRAARDAEEERLRKEKLEAPIEVEQEEN